MPCFAVAGLRPVGGAFAVAQLEFGGQALEEGLDATLVECLIGAAQPLGVFLEHPKKLPDREEPLL